MAEIVTFDDMKEGRVYPPLSAIREVSIKVAVKVSQYVYDTKMAAYYPEPEDKEKFIRAQLYDYNYESFIPEMYDFPAPTTS